MIEPGTELPQSLQQSKLAVLVACYGLLLTFLVGSIAAIGQLSLATPVIWLIQTVPLLIFMPGLHRGRPRSYAWVSFVVLLYFMHGVLAAFDPARRLLGIIEIFLCVFLFVAVIVFIRKYRGEVGGRL